MSLSFVIRKYFPQALAAGLCLFTAARTGQAIGQSRYIQETRTKGAFPIVTAKTAASIYVDSKDWFGVVRAAGDLQSDINKVSGVTANMVHDEKSLGANVIIVGTIGKSPLIDQLIRDKKIDVTGVTGKWEAFDIQVVTRPMPGVTSALVIAGSDKRGTIYGIYDVSEQIGVSPWYFWADVPVNHKDNLFVKAGRYMEGGSAVKYRGIFFNDEAPALDGWVREKFGSKKLMGTQPTNAKPFEFADMNHQFYSQVFELVLRMKGNFMWPAMWNNAFNEDDPLNAKTADVSVDWSKAPKETSEGTVKIARAGGEDVTVKLKASNPQTVTRANLKGFVETNGYVSIEAEHYAKKTGVPAARWEKIDDYGRTLSGMSLFPVTAPSMTSTKDAPALEYQMYLFSTGKAEVDTIMGPTLNFVPGRGIRFAIAFDDQEPKIVDSIGPMAGRDNLPRDWETIVKDSARHVKTTLDVTTPGYHTLKIWMVDPALVLQKVVVDMGGLKPSYLGPPESYRAGKPSAN